MSIISSRSYTYPYIGLNLPQIATAINLPALAIECERACAQVEKAISRETIKAQSDLKTESEKDR